MIRALVGGLSRAAGQRRSYVSSYSEDEINPPTLFKKLTSLIGYNAAENVIFSTAIVILGNNLGIM